MTILALEFMPISMRMTSPPLGREALVAAMEAILTAHGLEEVLIVGHSFGTVIATHALRSALLRPRVAGVVLVDPIPFLLHLYVLCLLRLLSAHSDIVCNSPHVAYNFVYRAPKLANEWQLWYFASRDPDIARTLARHFFWAEAILFKEELRGVRAAAVLAGADQIVHAKEVRRYLTGEPTAEPVWTNGEGMEVIWHEKLDHAVVFEKPKEREMLVQLVRRYLAELDNGVPSDTAAGKADGRAVAMNGHGTHEAQTLLKDDHEPMPIVAGYGAAGHTTRQTI